MVTMVRVSPHDSAILSQLVQFSGIIPPDEKIQLLNELQAAEARQVAEAILDPAKLFEAPEPVQRTANRYKEWVENNKRLGELRRRRTRSSR
jgi:hypothetical protein